ncbi:MAG: thiamine-phosphate kinase [Desulfocucumaceae bacterium]
MKLGDIGEFGLIDRIARGAVFNSRGLIKGIGDDAAVIAPGEGNVLLVSCDMLMERTHFIYGRTTPFQLGYKAIAVNISDIAAMGGKPRHVLVSLALPQWITVEDVEGIYTGMKDILSRWSVNIIGGDTVSSEVLAIDVTIIGEAPNGSVLTRGGARPGDVIMVTGNLGDSAAGLEILLRGEMAGRVPQSDSKPLLSAHLTPQPRLEQSSVLVKLGFVSAMMDISDGLAGDIKHICESSGTGAEIYTGSLPHSQSAARVAEIAGKSVIEWALSGGEDYELLFTVPQDRQEEVVQAFSENRLGPVTAVGRITGPEGGINIVGPDGKKYTGKEGFEHFAEP